MATFMQKAAPSRERGDSIQPANVGTSPRGSIEKEVHGLIRERGPVHYEDLLEETGDRIGRETLNRVLLDGMEEGRIARVDDFRYVPADR